MSNVDNDDLRRCSQSLPYNDIGRGGDTWRQRLRDNDVLASTDGYVSDTVRGEMGTTHVCDHDACERTKEDGVAVHTREESLCTNDDFE